MRPYGEEARHFFVVYNAMLWSQITTKPDDGRALLYQLTYDGSPVQKVLGDRGTEGVSYGGGLGEEAAALQLCLAITMHKSQE